MKKGDNLLDEFFYFSRNKRGQFFLLAAVVIAAVVLGLGTISNNVRINEEPLEFYNSIENLENEAGAVVDYVVYYNDDCNSDIVSCPDFESNLSNFIDSVSRDLRDSDNNLDIVVLYGDSSKVYIENHGAVDVSYDCRDGNGVRNISSRKFKSPVVEDGGASLETFGDLEDADKSDCSSPGDNLLVKIGDQDHSISFSEGSQVVFIVRKDVGGESYVSS